MAESLIFIENVNEIDLIEQYISKDVVVIAMLPAVGIELSQRGIVFENTKSLFGSDGHKETLEYSKSIVEGLRPFFKKIQMNGVQHAFEKTWIIYFRVHLNYLLASLFIINTAVKFHNPSKLIIIRNKYNNYNSLSELVEKYGLSKGIDIQYSHKSIANEPVNSISNESFFKKDKLKIQWVFNLIFEFQLRVLPLIMNNRHASLINSDASNMPRFVERVGRHFSNYFPVYLSVKKSSLKTRIVELFKGQSFFFLSIPKYVPYHLVVIFLDKYDSCSEDIRSWLFSSNKNAMVYGVDLSNPIMTCVENELKKRMTGLYGEIISLNRILDTVKPKSVFAQNNVGISYALGEACLKENIPGLLITHGSHVPQTDNLPSYEWNIHAHTIFNGMYPFVAIQTPWAKKFLNNQDEVISKTIDTGPLLFKKPSNNIISKLEMRSRLFGKGYAQKQIILHASSPRGWKSYKPWIYETIDEYVYNINTAIKVIEKIPNLYFCIRFLPRLGLSLKEFEISLVQSSCYGIYCEGSFDEFLMSSDLLMSYSSTTIEEALQIHIPVLQYDPDGKYEHIKGKVLSSNGINSLSTVYSVMTENDLKPSLLWWKENHSEDINRKLEWSEHSFENLDNMEWLEIMDIKC